MKLTSGLRFILLTLLFAIGKSASGQKTYFTQYGDASIALAGSQTSFSISYQYNINGVISKKQHKKVVLQVGFGARYSSYAGSDKYFVTVPELINNYGSSILDSDPNHADSVFVSSPRISTLNVLINISLLIRDRWRLGIDSDLIGTSFGDQKTATYVNGKTIESVTVVPASFNCIKFRDATGSIYTELYASYRLGNKWFAKVGLQFRTLEYITNSKVQQYPNPNDRFRLETLLYSAGLTYSIGKNN